MLLALALMRVTATAAPILDFSDNFDALSTVGSPPGWTSNYATDTWSTAVGGGVYPLTDDPFGTWGGVNEAADNILVYNPRSWGQLQLDVTLRTADDDAMGVVFRYVDANNFYIAFTTREAWADPATVRQSGVVSKLYRVQAAVATELGTSATAATGARQRFRVVANGPALEVWLDVNADGAFGTTERLIAATDTSFKTGKIGFYSYDHGAQPDLAAVFDDLAVSQLDTDNDLLGDDDEINKYKTIVGDTDSDDDGLLDGLEVFVTKTSPTTADTDGDKLSDGMEDKNGNGRVDAGETNPLAKDTDGDVVADNVDNCPTVTNGDQKDSDSDKSGDGCDPDDDNDSVIDTKDDCPFVANPDQADLDGDKVGDLCDPDADGDGVANGVDNCPLVANRDQRDADKNKIGDVCQPDLDGDGWGDDVDNCRDLSNKDQADFDADGLGDLCDEDIDGDGVNGDEDCDDEDPNGSVLTTYYEDFDEDGYGDDEGDTLEICADEPPPDYASKGGDNCPDVANADQMNTDGDNFGEVCDFDTDGDGLPDDEDNCVLVDNPDQADEDGDGYGDVCSGDEDGDGVIDLLDNCPSVEDPDQADLDGDGIGDPCDPDADGDGTNAADDCDDADPSLDDVATVFPDPDDDGVGDPGSDGRDGCADDPPRGTSLSNDDNCPEVYNPDQADSDGNGVGDACQVDVFVREGGCRCQSSGSSGYWLLLVAAIAGRRRLRSR